MAFKKVIAARKYFKYAECSPGEVLVKAGVYLGPEEGKFGIQHLFREEASSEVVCLNSAGQLNYLLEKHVTPGMICRVTYADKKLLTKGTFKGKEAHAFELEVDDKPLPPGTPEETPPASGDISL